MRVSAHGRSVPISAWLSGALLGGSALGACVAAVLAATVSAQPIRRVAHPSETIPSATSNRRAARIDAVSRLGGLQLPAGATSSPAEPEGGGSWLKPLPALSATPARVDVHAWWRVPGTPASVLAYVEAHRPAGAKVYSTGSGSGPGGQTMQTVSFSWPAIAGVLGERELAVTVVPLPGNSTGLLAQAESVWIMPRPAAERIPAGAHEIDVISAELLGPTTLSRHVSDVRKVKRIVSLIDAMPTVQPGASSCPALFLSQAHLLRFQFRSRVGGPVLAEASYQAFPGLADSRGPCGPLSLSIRGHREAALQGGRFLGRVQRILGFSLKGRR